MRSASFMALSISSRSDRASPLLMKFQKKIKGLHTRWLRRPLFGLPHADGGLQAQPARRYRLRRLDEDSDTPLKSIASSVASISTVAASPSGRSISTLT